MAPISQQVLNLVEATSQLFATGIRSIPSFTTSQLRPVFVKAGLLLTFLWICFVGIASLTVALVLTISERYDISVSISALVVGGVMVITGGLLFVRYLRRD